MGNPITTAPEIVQELAKHHELSVEIDEQQKKSAYVFRVTVDKLVQELYGLTESKIKL